MQSTRFDPQALPPIAGKVQINTGQFKGYAGLITRVDEQNRIVYFAITVFDRPVELSLDFESAASILDVLT
jgi:transcription antitermination factor NusG